MKKINFSLIGVNYPKSVKGNVEKNKFLCHHNIHEHEHAQVLLSCRSTKVTDIFRFSLVLFNGSTDVSWDALIYKIYLFIIFLNR